MRVLVAGDRGYMGDVLVSFQRAARHDVDELSAPDAEITQEDG